MRPRNQHCKNGTPEFVRRNVDQLNKLGLDGQCLIWLDSENDAAANFDEFATNNVIVKRNLRKECREQWLATARRVGDLTESRTGKNCYTGFVEHRYPGNDENRPVVSIALKVIERLQDAESFDLLIPTFDINTWWTNLPCQAETVIQLYHDHGTSEQFHRELKSDMDVENFPSGKPCVNNIILLCAMVAFNLLRSIGQEVIAPQKINVMRCRLKTVLQSIIYCAIRLVRHVGRMELHFGKQCLWYDGLIDIARAAA